MTTVISLATATNGGVVRNDVRPAGNSQRLNMIEQTLGDS